MPVAGSQTQIQGSKYSRKTVANISQTPVARCLRYQILILFERSENYHVSIKIAKIVLGDYTSNDRTFTVRTE